jgi:maltose-binding protein MalE
MWTKKKIEADLKRRYDDMSWEEIQEGLELVRLVAEFEQKYGEMPELKQFGPFIFGWKKVKCWKHDFNIFREGVKSGSKWAKEWIKNSGWLKGDIQKKFEQEEKEEETIGK